MKMICRDNANTMIRHTPRSSSGSLLCSSATLRYAVDHPPGTLGERCWKICVVEEGSRFRRSACPGGILLQVCKRTLAIILFAPQLEHHIRLYSITLSPPGLSEMVSFGCGGRSEVVSYQTQGGTSTRRVREVALVHLCAGWKDDNNANDKSLHDRTSRRP